MEEGLRGNEEYWPKVEETFNKIKSLEIQGATNVAKAALSSLLLVPPKDMDKVAKYLIKSRPTEPLMQNLLAMVLASPIEERIDNIKLGLDYLQVSKKAAGVELSNVLIKDEVETVATICHSSTVVEGLKEAAKKGSLKKVVVFETRPRYQGRITAKELALSNIEVEFYVDSAMLLALRKHKVEAIAFGNDAILSNGNVINKIGSNMLSYLASKHKVPVYSVGVSLKYTFSDYIKIEERDMEEVWNKYMPRLKIHNPAFEIVSKDYLTSIITELGREEPEFMAEKIHKKFSWLIPYRKQLMQ